jgi:hypothetical protein
VSLDRQERAEAAAENFARAATEMSFDREAFAQAIRRNHRTTQQVIAGAVFELIKQWAEDAETGNFDLRNADTVTACRAMVDALGPDGLMTRYI